MTESENAGNNTKKNKVISRKTLTLAFLAVIMCTAAVLIAEQPALAQTSSSNSTNGSTTTPTIKGSVSVSNATNAFVKANVKVDFNTAASTAKSQMANSVVIGGKLSEIQGYLAYTFTVANYDAGTSRIVIVDAGNGSVLYTSSDMPLYNGGLGGGGCHHGGAAYGGFGWGHQMSSGSSSSSSGTTGTSSGLTVLGNNL